MTVENSFKIYTTSPLLHTERPFIVTTVNVYAETVPRADWHLAIPEAPEPLHSARFNFDYDAVYYPGMDTELLHTLLLEDALASLRRHFRVKTGNVLLPMEDIHYRAEDPSIFLRYHVRGVFREAMNMLHANLRHADLRTGLQGLLTLQKPDIQRSAT